jgi:hypothetical protein
VGAASTFGRQEFRRFRKDRDPMKISVLAAMTLLLAAVTARAQVTLDELDNRMTERDRELSEFAARLNDPDPEKSLAAMKLLIEKGDADQRRLAIRYGLYSPDMAVRATILRAIFNSGPTLVVEMKPVAEETGVYFQREIKALGGSFRPDGTVSVVFKLAGYDEAQACWYWIMPNSQERCLLRLSADTVSLFIGDSWGQYTLNPEGALVGNQTVKDDITEARVSLAE